MANWGDVYTGIGLLGQTKRGSTDPMRQAYRRKGQVWKEGLGGIADTLGGIAKREDEQAFQGGQQTERIEADTAAQLRALKQSAGFHRDEMGMAGRRQTEIERAALASEEIARQEAANRGKLLEAQLADFEKPIDRAWRDALEEIALVFPEPFQGVDVETGYGVTYGLSSARENDPEMFSKMDAHFRNYIITKYPNEAEALVGLWETAIGGSGETPIPEPDGEPVVDGSYQITPDIVGKEQEAIDMITKLSRLVDVISEEDKNAVLDAMGDMTRSALDYRQAPGEAENIDQIIATLQALIDKYAAWSTTRPSH
jgi:hypothetical protein